MGWIIALLGGPEGVALMALKKFGTKLWAGIKWLFGHPLVLAALVAVGIIVFQHLDIADKAGRIVTLKANERKLADAAKIDRASNDRLTAAMSEQSAANRALNEASDKRLADAQKALAAATARGQRSDALAAQIDATRAHSKPGGACATSKAILDAKGVL